MVVVGLYCSVFERMFHVFRNKHRKSQEPCSGRLRLEGAPQLTQACWDLAEVLGVDQSLMETEWSEDFEDGGDRKPQPLPSGHIVTITLQL